MRVLKTYAVFLGLVATTALSVSLPAQAMGLKRFMPNPAPSATPTVTPTSTPVATSTPTSTPTASPTVTPSATPVTVNALTNPNPNPDCTLVVPDNALTAQGLATPFRLKATDPANGPCVEANPNQSAFVEAAIFDPATGAISMYRPLVVTDGDQPLVAPTPPTLPANAVVAFWMGFNGNILVLEGNSGQSLAEANCVDGLGTSTFGQVSYCNAPAFFADAYAAVKKGMLKVPALGKTSNGLPCPTTRSFSVVDQDQSDNVTTLYIADAQGLMAQDTPANEAANPNGTILANGSDNLLLTKIDAAVGCSPFSVPDLTTGANGFGLALNEISANFNQTEPAALVPLGDPMVMINGEPNPANGTDSAAKNALYREGVGQPVNATADTSTYCKNLLEVGLPRIEQEKALLLNAPSIDPAAANNLYTFLAQRFVASFAAPADGGTGLGPVGCEKLLGVTQPLSLTTDGNGVVTAASFSPNVFVQDMKHIAKRHMLPFPVTVRGHQQVPTPSLTMQTNAN